MENSTENGNVLAVDNQNITRHSFRQSCKKMSLPWLDLRVFYVRVTGCVLDDSAPEYLTLNHIPLAHDTFLEVNGVRNTILADGFSTVLRRDRLDKKSREVTFVSTDSMRMTGSVKFEVFGRDALVLSGVLELCDDNGFIGESKNRCHRWSMSCESDVLAGNGFSKGKHSASMGPASPTIEIYVAGSFSGVPIVLSNTLQFNVSKRPIRKGILDSIPEYEPNENAKDDSSGLSQQVSYYHIYNPENRDYDFYSGTKNLEGEDGEMSWFNAGVRVGVGIGLSICLGIGVGVGLLVRTYQGTTRNLRRRLI